MNFSDRYEFSKQNASKTNGIFNVVNEFQLIALPEFKPKLHDLLSAELEEISMLPCASLVSSVNKEDI